MEQPYSKHAPLNVQFIAGGPDAMLSMTTTEGSEMLSHIHELASAEPFQPFVIEMHHDKFTIKNKNDIEFTKSGNPKVHSGHAWFILSVDHITKCDPVPIPDQVSERMETIIRKEFRCFLMALIASQVAQAAFILVGIWLMLHAK